ncbi:hypothetical protein V5740_11365 [Croceibacterium sp. TMG7-5b_MA50]|uniref:hypothetical protein n=1 Tax=Croceibacterium sp. TMG7-5b_MA50 TaxID=3121290 RepID=UPI003221A4BD
MIRRRHPLLALLATAALAACGAPDDQSLPSEENTAVTPAVPTATPVMTPAPQSATAESRTVGGDGSTLALTPLTGAELEGVTLAGELACAFATQAGEPPLLLARGDVGDDDGRASFAIKIGDYVEQGLALEDGGFDAMLDGGRFGTKGMTLSVRNVGEPARGGGESPPRQAELLAQRADGAERVFAGTWTCGP